MAKNYINWQELELLSEIDKNVSLDDKAHKLGEEVGEFYQALLKFKGANNVSKSAQGNEKEHLLEELCDVLNVTLDIINALEITDDEAEVMFMKKITKWATKASKYGDKELVEKLSII